jgi:hypothetical protein
MYLWVFIKTGNYLTSGTNVSHFKKRFCIVWTRSYFLVAYSAMLPASVLSATNGGIIDK